MEALRNKSRFLLATDTLTGFAFAFFTYVTVFGGMGFASSQLYTATTSAVLLSAVLIFRSLRDLLIVPYFLRRIFKFFYERPLLFGTILFLPLTLTMIFRPLFMQVMFVDAGAVNQSIFQYFGAPPLHCDGCFQGSFLGDHQAYTLFLPWLWVQVFRTPYAIPYFAILCAVCTFGSIAYSFRCRLSTKLISFLLLAIFSIRGFRAGYVFDFREDALGALFFAFTLVFFHSRYWVAAAGTLFLASISKETGCILAPFLLPWFFFETRYLPPARRLAVTILFGGVVMFGVYLIFGKGIPLWAAPGGESNMLIGRLSYLGSTPTEILENFIKHPFRIFGAGGAGGGNHLRYLFHLVVPFIPFMLLAWNWAYFPGLVLAFGNLISLAPTQRSMSFHYDLLILPFFAFGLARSLELKSPQFSEKTLGLLILPFLIVSGVWPMRPFMDLWGLRQQSAERIFVSRSASDIPPSAPVLVDNLTYPHLVDHAELRMFPTEGRGRRPLADAQFAIVEGSLANRDAETRRYFSEFELIDCSSSKKFCFWKRRK